MKLPGSILDNRLSDRSRSYRYNMYTNKKKLEREKRWNEKSGKQRGKRKRRKCKWELKIQKGENGKKKRKVRKRRDEAVSGKN